MRRAADFSSTVRDGTRTRGRRIVVHHLASPVPDVPPLVGLVVSRSVGGSVVRHQVSRRLRAQLARRLPLLPVGTRTVVRALPAASSATSADLGADLDQALGRLAGVW